MQTMSCRAAATLQTNDAALPYPVHPTTQDSLEELLNNHADLSKSVAQALAALPRDLDRVCSSLVAHGPDISSLTLPQSPACEGTHATTA